MLPKAIYKGKLLIDGIELDCAVLDNEKRVFSERAVAKAVGSKRGGSHWRRKKEQGGIALPVYASAKNLAGFIDDDLRKELLERIEYESNSGGRIGLGVEATVLPKICEVYLKARDAGALLPSQMHIADQAAMLIRAFAKVGIIAMVDEVTGYQEQRNKDELSRLLACYLSEERLRWAKRFPDKFYQEIYRLNGWPWPPVNSSKRPGIVGQYTNDIVYERLPEGILSKLKELNPVNPLSGRRRFKHHQYLSEDVGQEDLQKHLLQVITLMKASRTWNEFIRFLDRVFPKGSSYQLDLLDKNNNL